MKVSVVTYTVTTTYRPVGGFRRFGEACCLHLLLYMKSAVSPTILQDITNHCRSDIIKVALKREREKRPEKCFISHRNLLEGFCEV